MAQEVPVPHAQLAAHQCKPRAAAVGLRAPLVAQVEAVQAQREQVLQEALTQVEAAARLRLGAVPQAAQVLSM